MIVMLLVVMLVVVIVMVVIVMVVMMAMVVSVATGNLRMAAMISATHRLKRTCKRGHLRAQPFQHGPDDMVTQDDHSIRLDLSR